MHSVRIRPMHLSNASKLFAELSLLRPHPRAHLGLRLRTALSAPSTTEVPLAALWPGHHPDHPSQPQSHSTEQVRFRNRAGRCAAGGRFRELPDISGCRFFANASAPCTAWRRCQCPLRPQRSVPLYARSAAIPEVGPCCSRLRRRRIRNGPQWLSAPANEHCQATCIAVLLFPRAWASASLLGRNSVRYSVALVVKLSVRGAGRNWGKASRRDGRTGDRSGAGPASEPSLIHGQREPSQRSAMKHVCGGCHGRGAGPLRQAVGVGSIQSRLPSNRESRSQVCGHGSPKG